GWGVALLTGFWRPREGGHSRGAEGNADKDGRLWLPRLTVFGPFRPLNLISPRKGKMRPPRPAFMALAFGCGLACGGRLDAAEPIADPMPVGSSSHPPTFLPPCPGPCESPPVCCPSPCPTCPAPKVVVELSKPEVHFVPCPRKAGPCQPEQGGPCGG